MKRKDEVYAMKQAAMDKIAELQNAGIKAGWFRNKNKDYVVFYWVD